MKSQYNSADYFYNYYFNDVNLEHTKFSDIMLNDIKSTLAILGIFNLMMLALNCS